MQIGRSVATLPHLHHRESEIAGIPVLLRKHQLLGVPAVDIFCPPGRVAQLRSNLIAAGAAAGDEQTYETLRLEAGLPEFGKDIDENRSVMEIGRVKEAISYSKGCFLGQEPIVMARDRGHVNRNLMGLKAVGNQPMSSGATALHDNEESGLVTSSVWSPRLQCAIALAYMKRGHQQPGTKVFVDGREAEVVQLPFTRPSHSEQT